ncbi:hypothetical protein U3516DRAFT_738537 [Neocallimastix sp. 'constans']
MKLWIEVMTNSDDNFDYTSSSRKKKKKKIMWIKHKTIISKFSRFQNCLFPTTLKVVSNDMVIAEEIKYIKDIKLRTNQIYFRN